MALMRTSNPTLNERVFRNVAYAGGEPMTAGGTVNRTGILLVCAFATAAWTWSRTMVDPAAATVPLVVGLIGGLVFALVTVFKKEWAPVTAPIYALAEGLLLGGFSAMLERQFPGIAVQAVGLTFGTLLAMLLAYRSGLIHVTARFRMGVVAATGGIMLFYLVTFVASMFGLRFTAFYGNSTLAIGVSLVIVAVAALNLVLDFDFIEQGVAAGAPKYMEWYAAFGLMVTLVWLYIEILRLLSMLRSRE